MNLEKFIYEKKDLSNTFFTNREVVLRTSKININCGYCKNNKGCEIKNSFRALTESIQYKSTHNMDRFKLKCPFIEYKYRQGDRVKFTVAYGCHRVYYDWECTNDCDYCNRSKCNSSGIIRFKQKRYLGNVEFEGEIISAYTKDKYIISVDLHQWLQKKNVFNRYDLLKLKSISDKLKYFDDDFDMRFISKLMFIKK